MAMYRTGSNLSSLVVLNKVIVFVFLFRKLNFNMECQMLNALGLLVFSSK